MTSPGLTRGTWQEPGRLATWHALPIMTLGYFFRDVVLGSPCLPCPSAILPSHPTCHKSLKYSSIAPPSGLCHLLFILQSQLSLLQEAFPHLQARLGLLILLP